MADINGVRYYKRRAIYENDVTLNKSLLGEEIDGNFFFLRGNDIDKIGVDEENHLLTLERVNGQKLTVDISQEIGDTVLSFDPETGVLHVVTPASEYDVTGFLSLETGLHIASDETLKGEGTIEKPLGISENERTGMLAVADEYIDMTGEYVLPVDVVKGYRYVSKERIDDFGLLYNYAGVEKIAEYLAEISSEWRVPSREDWASMLDAVEDADACRTKSMHDSEESGVYLGEVAGARLKSTNLWSASTAPGLDEFGFNVLPLGYIDESGSELDDVVYKRASFWTSTEESLRQEVYIKGFAYNTPKVYQGTWDQRAKASLRLVKDNDGSNFFTNEIIAGETVPCVQMPNGTIWTSKNIGFRDEAFSGVTSEKWEEIEHETNIGFYINTFDGRQWIKRRMTDGETIVIKLNEDKEYSTWRVIGDELRGLDGVVDLDAETKARINGDNALAERIETLSSALTEALERVEILSERVSELEDRDFWAIYGTTSEAEIRAANTANKNVCCKYNSCIYRLAYAGSSVVFSCTTNLTTPAGVNFLTVRGTQWFVLTVPNLITSQVLDNKVGPIENKVVALNGATADTFLRNVMEVIDDVVLGYPQNISVVKVDSNDHITESLDDTVAFRIKFAPDVIFLADTIYENDDNIEP